MSTILVLLAAIGAALWATRDWRRGLRAVMVLLVVEGALRKWVVPDAANFVYFAKDVVLLGVYGGFLLRRPKVPLRPAVPDLVVGALVLGALVGLLQVFNPRLPNLLVGLLGLKAYFFYIPLLWVVPAAFANDRELYSFLRRYLYLALPVGVLAGLQFVSPAESWINAYAPQGGGSLDATVGIATFGASRAARVTGTFSYISGFTTFLTITSLVALCVLAMDRWRFRRNALIYLSLGMILGSIFTTGSRGPFVLLAVLFPFYWILAVAREGGIPASARLLLGLAVLLALVNVVGADAVEAFWARAKGAGDSLLARTISPFVSPFRTAGEVGFAGYGIGAAHQAAAAVTRGVAPYSWLGGQIHENETTRVMVEMGILGWVLVFFVRGALAVMALRSVFRLRSSFHRLVGLSCALIFLPHMMGGVVFNVTGGVYFWFFAGVLMLARRLDREALVARWMARRAVAAAEAPLAPAPLRPVVAQ